MQKFDFKDYIHDYRVKKRNKFTYILPEDWTKQEMEEWLKCRMDPLYFIKNYVYIMHEGEGNRVLLQDYIYQPQEDLITNLLEKRKVIVLKTRQTGITTIISQYIQYLLLFNRQYKTGVLSHKREHQSGFVDRKLKIILRHLPPFFMKPVKKNNTTMMVFQDGDEEESWIMSEAPGPSSYPFTGETLNFVFIDEQSKIPHIDNHYKSFSPAQSSTLNQSVDQQIKRPSGIAVVSTPNGTDGTGKWFYEKYIHNTESSTDQEKDFYPMFIHWKDCGFDIEWYNSQKSLLNNDMRQIRQELDQEFIGSGETYYTLENILKIEHIIPLRQKIGWIRKPNYEYEEPVYDYQYVNIWEEPKDGHQYIIQIDPQDSSGDTQDTTQIEVIDGYTQCQVQEFRGHINTIEQQYLFRQIQQKYNNQIAGIERNKGFHIIDKLYEELEYDNIYYGKSAKGEGKPGIQVTGSNRKQIIDLLDILLIDYNKDEYNFIRSKDLIDELLSFTKSGISNRGEQKSGKHDDLIFQFCYQLYVRDNTMSSLFKSTSVDIENKINIQQIEQQYDMVNLIKSIRG